MNWCNKLTGNTCKLIKRIMSTLPTAAQRLYKKLNTKLYFLYYLIWETNFSKRILYYLLFNFIFSLVLFLFFSRP